MRFAPQVWFSLAMRLISAGTSSLSGGLPGLPSDFDLRLQILRNRSGVIGQRSGADEHFRPGQAKKVFDGLEEATNALSHGGEWRDHSLPFLSGHGG